MFKKPPTVAFKGEQRLKGKDAKRLREAVEFRLGGEEVAAALLPSKADIVVRKVGGGSSMQFMFVDGECLLVQPDGRTDVAEAELVPTLLAFWRLEDAAALLPCVVIQRPVTKFIFRGADLMAPGVHSFRHARGAEEGAPLPPVGALVAIVALGNPSACAVGRLKVPAASLGGGGKGEAVEVLHYFGDCLWEACGSRRPKGFVGDEVQATESAAEAPSAPSAPEAVGTDESPGEPAVRGAEAEPADAEGAASGAEAAEEEAAADEEGPSAAAASSPEAMARALEECLLQAIKTRVKDKDLPIKGNELYAQHMRPCRRAGSNIDVKSSSHKKLVAFLSHCESLGWIALKAKAPEPVVTKICRDHPDVREWKPWPRSETAEAAEPGDSKGSAGPVARVEVEPVWRAAKLKALLEAVGSAPEDGCLSREECIEVLKRYADEKGLWQKNNRKRLAPDELLLGLLGEDSGLSLDGATDKLLGSLPACHRVAIPQGGAIGGMKRSVRQGKPPVVQVRTDTRRGHSVTLIHGLEAYGVDMEAFAACLQKALATSAVYEEQSSDHQAAIMVQGFWDQACAEWLGKIGVPAASVQATAKKGQQQKKVKQGTNIVKH